MFTSLLFTGLFYFLVNTQSNKNCDFFVTADLLYFHITLQNMVNTTYSWKGKEVIALKCSKR